MPMIKWRVEPTKLTKNFHNPNKCPTDFTDLANDVCTNIILQLSCLCKHSQDLFNELEQQTTKISNRTIHLSNRVKGLKEKAASLNPTVEEVSLDDIILCKPYKSSNVKDASLQERPNAVLEIYAVSQPIPALHKLNPYRSPEEKDCVKLYSNPEFFFESWCRQVNQEVEKINPKRKKRPQKNQAKPERIPINRNLDRMRDKVKDDIMQPGQKPPVPAPLVQQNNASPTSSERKLSTSSVSSGQPSPSLSPKPSISGKPKPNIIRDKSFQNCNPAVRPSILPPPPPCSTINECRESVDEDAFPPAPHQGHGEIDDNMNSLPPPPSTPVPSIPRP